MKADRDFVLQYAEEYFGALPEYLWEKTPEAGVLRHSENRKWFGLVMSVSKKRLGLSGDGFVDILNVKCDPLLLGSMLLKEGYLPAYHMNKKHWLTVLLDGSVTEEEIAMLLHQSFELTADVMLAKKQHDKKRGKL